MLPMTALDRCRAPDDALEVAAQQGDAGAFDRHIGTRPHGDADIGGGEGRCVVDAVAGHGDDTAFGPKLLHHRGLVLGQHLRADVVDAQAARHGLSGRAIVARHHHQPKTCGLQVADGVGGGGLHRIGDAEDAGDRAVDRDEDGRSALLSQGFGLGLKGPDIDPRPPSGSGHCPETDVGRRPGR